MELPENAIEEEKKEEPIEAQENTIQDRLWEFVRYVFYQKNPG